MSRLLVQFCLFSSVLYYVQYMYDLSVMITAHCYDHCPLLTSRRFGSLSLVPCSCESDKEQNQSRPAAHGARGGGSHRNLLWRTSGYPPQLDPCTNRRLIGDILADISHSAADIVADGCDGLEHDLLKDPVYQGYQSSC